MHCLSITTLLLGALVMTHAAPTGGLYVEPEPPTGQPEPCPQFNRDDQVLFHKLRPNSQFPVLANVCSIIECNSLSFVSHWRLLSQSHKSPRRKHTLILRRKHSAMNSASTRLNSHTKTPRYIKPINTGLDT